MSMMCMRSEVRPAFGFRSWTTTGISKRLRRSDLSRDDIQVRYMSATEVVHYMVPSSRVIQTEISAETPKNRTPRYTWTIGCRLLA